MATTPPSSDLNPQRPSSLSQDTLPGLAQLLDHLPAVFMEIAPNGTIQEIQGNGLQWLSLRRDELLGQPAQRLEASLVGFRLEEHHLGMDLHLTEGALRPQGSWQSYLMPQPQGGWLGYIWVHATKAAPHANQLPLLSYFIQHAPAAIAMFDEEMHYLMVSDRWMEVYQLTESVIGQSHYEIFPEMPERWRRAHRRCLSGVIEKCEADPFPRLDGHTDYINWVVAPWYKREEEVGGLIFYTEKVNEQVEAKQRLLHLNQALKRSNERLKDFALAVSHTLREPLSLTIAQGQQLIHDLEQRNDLSLVDQAEDWLNHLYRMESIMTGLLAHAHVEEPATHRIIALDEVMNEVKVNLQAMIDERQAHIHYGSLPSIEGNEFELIALFQQLIAQAIDNHDTPSAEVIVSATRPNGQWQFRVQDHGTSLTLVQQEALLTFAHDLTRAREHGIGLAVCQRIIHRMGGRIWIESGPAQGNTFCFTLGQEV
jgi:PAS domain S-box-containing protein